VKRIAENAERIEEVLRRVLSVSEDLRVMGKPGWSRLDLGGIVTDVLRRARPATQQIHVLGEGATIDGNTALLERLVENLLTNALLHTPPTADIWIRVRSG